MLCSARAAGEAGATLWSAGGARGLGGLRARPAGRYPGGGGWRFCWRYWFWQILSSELNRLGVVYVDCVFQSTIFVDHLVFVGDAADSIGSFPSRCQLGGTFGRGGEGED